MTSPLPRRDMLAVTAVTMAHTMFRLNPRSVDVLEDAAHGADHGMAAGGQSVSQEHAEGGSQVGGCPPTDAAPDPPLPAGDVFAREAPRQAEYERARAALRSESQLTRRADAGPETLDTPLVRGGSGFRFSAQPLDAHLQPLHIEPLLDQAADLLERCLAARAVGDELMAKAADLAFELHEYADLDEIHTREAAAGYYSVDAREARALRDAERTTHTSNWRVFRVLNQASSDYRDDTREALVEYARQQARLPVLFTPHFEGKSHKPTGKPAVAVHDYIGHSAKALQDHALALSQHDYRMRLEAAEGQSCSAAQRVSALAARAQWEAAAGDFRRERTEVARRYQDLKLRASVESGGTLNYAEQARAFAKRVEQDLRHAVARMRAILPALDAVYGYREPLPREDGGVDYLDRCVTWVRETIDAMQRFARVEQNYVIPVSLRRTSVNWADGLRTGTWSLRLTEAAFPAQSHVRLRGLSAIVVDSDGGEVDNSLWQVTVRAPQAGFYRHIDNATRSAVAQSTPACRLARVAGRAGRRDPDFVGVNALHNASPIGEWQIVIGAESLTGRPRNALRDVHLDLHLAVRELPGGRS